MSRYLKIAEEAQRKAGVEAATDGPRRPTGRRRAATKATEATKGPEPGGASRGLSRDRSDESDRRPPNFVPLTVAEARAEINHAGSGANLNAALYRSGELFEEKAVEYVTCAILARRREGFGAWRLHAPAVRKALALCKHDLEPDACKVCNGYVKTLIEKGAGA